MQFFSGESQFAKSNQVSFLICYEFDRNVNALSEVNIRILSGGFEEHINCICKVESWYKICARDERNSGIFILCV